MQKKIKKKNGNYAKFVAVAVEKIGKGELAVVEVDRKEKIIIVSRYKSDIDFLNLTSENMKK